MSWCPSSALRSVPHTTPFLSLWGSAQKPPRLLALVSWGYHRKPHPLWIQSNGNVASPCSRGQEASKKGESTNGDGRQDPPTSSYFRKSWEKHQWGCPAGSAHLFLLPEVMGLCLWHFRLCIHHYVACLCLPGTCVLSCHKDSSLWLSCSSLTSIRIAFAKNLFLRKVLSRGARNLGKRACLCSRFRTNSETSLIQRRNQMISKP